MDSPSPQQSGFDILSWLRTPRTLRTPRVCGGHLVFFVSNPYNMGVYGLPWPPAIRIWHFELTQDPEDTEGLRRSLGHLCSKPLQYGFLQTRLDPSKHVLGVLDPGAKFWVQGPLGPKFENLQFAHKTLTCLAHSIIFEAIWTLGPNFGSKW